jgi:hypothetical protein
MKRFVLLLLFAGCPAAALEPPPARIQFSEDERFAVVRHGGRTWKLPRPVISPWRYEETNHVYWVAPDGDNAADGTRDKPLRTIGAAIAQAQAGDIVYVLAGTYVESVTITRSGGQTRPLILSCAPGDLGKVKITPPKEYVEKNTSGAVITVKGARNVWINGLVIEGPLGRPEAPKEETYGANGITWADKAGPGCRATNNVIYHNVHCGLKEMGHGGFGLLVEGNIIFANGTNSRDHGIYMPASDVVLNGNICFDNAGYGIHSYEKPTQQLIVRNVCFANKVCGIILAGRDNKAYHNVCAGNGIGLFYFRGGCTGNDVRDNIFAFNRTDCGYDNGGGKLGDPSANTDDHNCYFPGKPDRRLSPGSHELLADPQFRDAASGDFRLKEKSPCKGKAVNMNITGVGETPDLGAY